MENSQKMVIKLENINNRGAHPIYVGDRTRLATATDVAFLDEHTMVVTSLVGHRMYLIEFDLFQGSHRFIDCIPTVFNDNEIRTDLLDFDGENRLITSNCEFNSVSLYDISRNKLSHVKDIAIPDPYVAFCHGARFVPGNLDVVCATCTNNNWIYFLSIESSGILYQFKHEKWKPKNACFIDSNRMVVAYASGNPTQTAAELYSAKVALIEFDIERQSYNILAEKVFPETHPDTCTVVGDMVYFNNQMKDSILACQVQGNELNLIQELPGYSFPHGMDILPEKNLMAVTNYGTNTVVLSQLPAHLQASKPAC